MASDETHGCGFIAVHVGAGYHSPANSDLYKDVCRRACTQAMKLLRAKKSSLEAIKIAMMCLEDSPWTNAGVGSNLTLEGTVECDASVMDGHSLYYGAVGALSGIKNPVLVAESLLKTQQLGCLSLGRVPPSTLVSQGAYEWARKKNIPVVKSDSLITDSTKKAFIKHKRRIDMLEEGLSPAKKRKISNGHFKPKVTTDGTVDRSTESEDDTDCLYNKVTGNSQKGACVANTEQSSNSVTESEEDSDCLYDTVGAVCIDHEGHISSAVSSGGIVLKQPGRLGQAALYGCGCWAENDMDSGCGVAISTSGCGEHLSKTLLARECAESLKQQDDPTGALNNVFTNSFLKSPLLRDISQKLGGALALKLEPSQDQTELDVEVLWAHTTDSMCLAFMATSDKQPTALVSRLPNGSGCGKSCVVQSQNIVLGRPTDLDIHKAPKE